MLDPAIENFLVERLKKKNILIPTSSQLLAELDEWLPLAAKKAGKLFTVTHPVKFSHPDAKNTSEIRVTPEYKADGFLRTGNANAELDTIFDTSANIPIWKFLSLKLIDDKSVLQHLQQNSELIKQQLTISSLPFTDIQRGLLAITELSDNAKTSGKIKQVYFPVADDYHLLSILTPSGLMFKLRQRINEIRFSDEAKQAREAKKKQEHHSEGFTEIYGLTAIGYGGTKPQNISVLNNQNGGVAYLLASIPPSLGIKTLRPPTTDFFRNNLYVKNYQDSFETFHRLLTVDHNDANVRQGFDNVIAFIINQVIEQSWIIRQLDAGWSADTKAYKNLPDYQKIWLDNTHIAEREIDDEWLREVITQLGLWFQRSYKRLLGEVKAKLLGDDELSHIKRIIEENKEGLL